MMSEKDSNFNSESLEAIEGNITREDRENLEHSSCLPKRGPNSKRSEKKWTKEEDELLLQLAERTKGKRWKWISSKLPGKKDTQCRSRWERIRPGMKQGRWTLEEDELLVKLYKQLGEKWAEIASHLVNRTGKQVRDRIKNVYDPSISHEKFRIEDDELIYKLYLERGPKWKEIKEEFFPNRTADFIKNRFYSHYQKFKAKYGDNIETLPKRDQTEGTTKPDNPKVFSEDASKNLEESKKSSNEQVNLQKDPQEDLTKNININNFNQNPINLQTQILSSSPKMPNQTEFPTNKFGNSLTPSLLGNLKYLFII